MEEEIEVPDEEYETQFFGFSPTDVFAGIKELINDRFEDAINKLAEQMKMIPKSLLSEEELRDGIAELRSITRSNNDKILFKLKKHLLQSIMRIPPDVLLPEDAEQSQFSPEEFETLTKEIETLKKNLKMEKFMESFLREELKDIELVLKKQKHFIETELLPLNETSLDEEVEKVSFLAENVKYMMEAFNSLTMSAQDPQLNRLVGEEFEQEILQ